MTSSQLVESYLDVAASGPSSRQLVESYVDALTTGSPPGRLTEAYVDVLYSTQVRLTASMSAALATTATLTAPGGVTDLGAVTLSSAVATQVSVGVTDHLSASATAAVSTAVTLTVAGPLTPSTSAAAVLSVSLTVKQPLGTASATAALTLGATLTASSPASLTASTSAALTLGVAGLDTKLSLGHATMAAGVALAAVSYQQGTLAYPFAIAGSGGSLSVDRAQFTTVASDPAEVVPGSTDSFWLVFTEGEARNFFASVSATFGVPMELYVGPDGAGPDDLTLFDFDGGAPLSLGSVSLSAAATTGVDLFKQLGSTAASAEVSMGAILG